MMDDIIPPTACPLHHPSFLPSIPPFRTGYLFSFFWFLDLIAILSIFPGGCTALTSLNCMLYVIDDF